MPDAAPDAEELAELEATLARHALARERLGAVNLRALDEVQELAMRIETLQAEQAELTAALERLRRAIATLNREGRERLRAAFAKVEEHFEALFVRLFGGGRAKLELTDLEDPLAAGLELAASPPGKKLQSVSLLSGGEKALTAIALIFAVFLTRPAPLCILDEVDAPLDDANVERLGAPVGGAGAKHRDAFRGGHPPSADHGAHGPAVRRHHGRARHLGVGFGRPSQRRGVARDRLIHACYGAA